MALKTSKPAEWYFDFISPFAYLQFEQMERVSALAAVTLTPILRAGILQRDQRGPGKFRISGCSPIDSFNGWPGGSVSRYAARPRIPSIPSRRCASRSRSATTRRQFGPFFVISGARAKPWMIRPIGDLSLSARHRRCGTEDRHARGEDRTRIQRRPGDRRRRLWGADLHHRRRLFWGVDATDMVIDYLRNPSMLRKASSPASPPFP